MEHIFKALDNAITLKEFAIESLKKENDALKKENDALKKETASLISKIYHLEAKLHLLEEPPVDTEEGGVENVE